MNYFIALDVGGTTIKAGVLFENGKMANESVHTYPAKANDTKENILNNLFYIIKTESSTITPPFRLKGVGMAFPGPFDYENGTSLMLGLGKYENLFQVNVKDELMELIKGDPFFDNKLENTFTIKFENDAFLYALGESYTGVGKSYNKALYICLGTGIGSAFIENCELIKHRADVPEDGWIFNKSFGDGIIDDYISTRGILNIASSIFGNKFDGTVLNLYEMAKNGDTSAVSCFYKLGSMLGQALLPFVKTFDPEAIIIGGQISKSYEYFKHSLETQLQAFNPEIAIAISEDSSISTLVGVYGLFNNGEEKRNEGLK